MWRRKKYQSAWKTSKLQGGKLECKLTADWISYGISIFLGIGTGNTREKNSSSKSVALGT